ncbi:MAG: HPr family phosphocarrier protein [Candidatus Omnitrophica bacterium]|nr:HPr family phosphocarrier protein [Candidatus Omnitrophota bacterium]
MLKIEKEITINSEQGLHARPAALFVQLANKFDCEIIVRKGSNTVSGKSIMGILMLAAERGSKLIISAEGEDAQKAVEELGNFLGGVS